MQFKTLICMAISVVGLLGSSAALPQALPVYTAPTSRLGGAIAEGITQTMVRRGFAANDPRVLQTIQAVSSRTAASVAAAGAGTTWLGYVSRLNPWITAGFLIYAGYKWYTSNDGTVKTEVLIDPSLIGGIASGGAYWVANGIYGSEPYSIAFQSVMPSSSGGWTVWSFSYTGSDTFNGYTRNKFAYSLQHPTYCTNGGCQSGTAYAEYHPSGSPGSCTAGSYYKAGSGCLGYSFRLTNGNTGQTTTGQTYQQAYDALPQVAKDAALHPQTAAEITNRAWRDAAQQPDYPGVPWSSVQPTIEQDFQPHIDAHPSDWPKTSDLPSAVPSSGPIKSPDTNPNQSTAPSSATVVNLGPDPGTPSPNLDGPPDDLFKPIKDLLQPWLGWHVPSHSSTCPTWQAAPSIAGNIFAIDISYHCQLAEQFRAAIQAAALACWAALAAFIVLSA